MQSISRPDDLEEYDFDLDLMEKEMEEDGKLDFEQIYQKSKKLHSR